MAVNPSQKDIIRSLNPSEIAQHIQNYSEQFFKSTENQPKHLLKEVNASSLSHNQIDPNCIIDINQRLIRVEVPGDAINLDKTMECLGGMENIETCVADHRKKLEMHFHPLNLYNKPAVADRDYKPGILIKVKFPQSEATETDRNYEYSVEGATLMNFTFNRMTDYQYLPLLAEQPESSSSAAKSIYNDIMPEELPTSDWFIQEESKNKELLLLPVRLSHQNISQIRLQTENNENNEAKIKMKNVASTATTNKSKQRRVCRIFGKVRQQISIFVNFTDKDVPTKPLESTLKLIRNRNLQDMIERVKQLFKERPIWTKAAIRWNTGLTNDQSKIVLPVVAYYFLNGPWRISWVKYGYDPRKDPKARIYQTLDYRIRTVEGTKLKVKAKRNYTAEPLLNLESLSLKDDVMCRPRSELDERCYVLKPLTIPPARQMFYQICDLILPEIQELISKLLSQPEGVCDAKNGWLPKNFIEKCRDIVNNHVLIAVQKALVEDRKKLQKKLTESGQKKEPSTLDYCNEMLSSVKKGIYKNIDIKPIGLRQEDVNTENLNEDVEQIELSSDEEEYTVGDIIRSSIPETIDDDDDDDDDDEDDEENFDNESISHDETDLDLETVDELHNFVAKEKNND